MREKLVIGQKYLLGNNTTGKHMEVRITNHVGEGASCIVYDGYYLDEYKLSHNVRVKECFPHHCTGEKREGNVVQWRGEKDKETALERFKMAYMQHLHLQKLFVNSTAHAEELFEANNTAYVLMDMDDGQSFEKVEVRNLHSLLKTLCALSATVKRYHERRLLHLDLKPENFMVIPETEELVKLFDFDSIVSMDEINDGDIPNISYSERWAAPEVKQRKYKDIKETADIYSIGAILFYYLSGRYFGVKDVISFGRYDWMDECLLLQGVNPAIKKYLIHFLNKTLASAVKMRYQTMDEICAELKVMIRLSDENAMFLKSSMPRQNNAFVGREQELKEIHHRLQGQNCLLINGVGGIGKTELVKEYAIRYEKEYSHIVYISCMGSISNCILSDSNIVITNYSQENSGVTKKSQKEYVKERIAVLKQVVEEDTLFIIDDIREFDDSLNWLLEVKCKFILTSREFPRALMRKREVFSIDGMSSEVLMELFRSNHSAKLTAEQESVIYDIIAEVKHYTLLISIIAKTMDYYGIAPEVMLSRLREGGMKGTAKGRIKHSKDGTTLDATIYEHVASLFDLSGMGEVDKLVMRNMAILEPYALTLEMLLACTILFEKENDELKKEELKGTLTRLLDAGWLCFNEESGLFYLPHALAEIVVDQLECNVQSCEKLFQVFQVVSKAIIMTNQKREENVETRLIGKLDVDDTLKVYVDDETDYEIKAFNNLILHCLRRLDKSDERNIRYLVEFGFVNAENKELGKGLLEILEELRLRYNMPQIIGNEYYVMLCLAIVRIIELLAIDYSEEDVAKMCQCMKAALEYGRKVTSWTLFRNYSQLVKYLEMRISGLYGVFAKVLKGQKIPRSFFDAFITISCAMEGISEKKLSKEARRDFIKDIERELYVKDKELEQVQIELELEELLAIRSDMVEEIIKLGEDENGETFTPEEKKAYGMILNRMMGKTWNEKETAVEVYKHFYAEITERLSSGCEQDYTLLRDLLTEKEISISDKASLLYYWENSPYDVYSKNLINRNKIKSGSTLYEVNLVKNVLLKNGFYKSFVQMDTEWILLENTLLFWERKQYGMFMVGIVLIIGGYSCSSQSLLAFGQLLGHKGMTVLELLVYMCMEKGHVLDVLGSPDEEDDLKNNREFALKFYEAYEACALKMECADLVNYIRRRKSKIGGINFYKGIPTPVFGTKADIPDLFLSFLKAYFDISNKEEKLEFIENVKKETSLPLKYKELLIQACNDENNFMNFMYSEQIEARFAEGSEQTIRRERRRLEKDDISDFERMMSLAACVAEYLILEDTVAAHECITEYCLLMEKVFLEKNSVQIMLLFELADFICERTQYASFCNKIDWELMKQVAVVYREFGYYEIKMISAPVERCLRRLLELCEKGGVPESSEEYTEFQKEFQKYKDELGASEGDEDYVEFCLACRDDYSIPLKEYESRKFKEQIVNGGLELGKSLMKQMMRGEAE